MSAATYNSQPADNSSQYADLMSKLDKALA
jgi:hypothetical protein